MKRMYIYCMIDEAIKALDICIMDDIRKEKNL